MTQMPSTALPETPFRATPKVPSRTRANALSPWLTALAAATVFVGAFLLFLVQPIASKQILPWYGGSAAVWAVSLSFFQVALLAGYGYAHVLVRWVPRRWQLVLHGGLLMVAVLSLEVLASETWKPVAEDAGDPSLQIVGMLAASVGLPYLLLSATGPLVQSWVASAGASQRVYRLFALGNLASIGGLLAYPFGIEPIWPLKTQAAAWAFGFGLYAGLCLWTGWLARSAPGGKAVAHAPAPAASNPAERLSPARVGAWVLLSALGTALLVATTNHLTRDVTAVPFLWVLPLVLYLLSFVVVFDSERLYRGQWWWIVAVLSSLAWCAVLVPLAPFVLREQANGGQMPIQVLSFCAGLFLACVWLHGEMARSKPEARSLTAFYFSMAVGGALGGLCVSLVAPRTLPAFYELGAAYTLVVALLAWRMLGGSAAAPAPRGGLSRRLWTGLAGLAVAVCATMLGIYVKVGETKWQSLQRNFYGVLAVGERDTDDPQKAYRALAHGSIMHGAQYSALERRREATTYYTPSTGIGRAIEATRVGAAVARGQRIGMIGLGAGTTAVYGRAGDVHRFYEINPLVIDLAQRQFSFLNDSAARIETALGDARLVLAAEAPQAFDVLAVDAFSGDAVPAHLLTREAMGVYRRHLARGGVLAFHISNKHLELGAVVGALARDAGMSAVRLRQTGTATDISQYEVDWVLLADDPAVLAREPIASGAEPLKVPAGQRTWTDDFNDLLGVLKY
jgi:hypothetical protein